MSPPTEPFEVLTLEQLRSRRSAKWREHPPDVLPLWVAEMDAMPPPSVAEALVADLLLGDTGYPPHDDAYAEALARLAARRWGWTVEPDRVAVCADVLTGVHAALSIAAAPGAAVAVPTPVYPPLLMIPEALGLRVEQVEATPSGRLDIEALAGVLARPEVSVVLLCSPHNPLGTVHSAEELRQVADLAVAHGATVVVDEIHAPLVPEGRTFTPYLAVADRGITVTSASKAYNLAGLKAGALVVGPGSDDLLARVPPALRYGAATFGIRAHVAAWDGGDAWLDTVNAGIADNAALLADLLADRLPQVRYRAPEASYLAWLDCRDLGLGADPAAAFLEHGRVALSAGPTFGRGGEGFARLNLACSRAVLHEAVDRLARTLEITL